MPVSLKIIQSAITKVRLQLLQITTIRSNRHTPLNHSQTFPTHINIRALNPYVDHSIPPYLPPLRRVVTASVPDLPCTQPIGGDCAVAAAADRIFGDAVGGGE